jgi:predicted nucleic acid-binding protein
VKVLLVDTNILIDYSRGKNKDLEKISRLVSHNDYQLALSAVNIFEYWIGSELNFAKKTDEAQKLLSHFSVIDIDEAIAKKAAELFRKEKVMLPLTDLIIAATAILNHCELVTHNQKHFAKIKGLKLFDLEKI